MKINPLKKLETLGQSLWLDYVNLEFIRNNELKKLINEDGLKGLTTNPILFEKAISEASAYVKNIQTLIGNNKDVNSFYETITQKYIQDAADEFRPLYESSNGRDGYVSLEVNPHLAYDTEGTIKEAIRLWENISCPNALIKVPATIEGLAAIKQLISEGINVNVTLLFGLSRYHDVAEAYISGIETRLNQGKPVNHISSVASFFLSRIDANIDPILENFYSQNEGVAILAKKLHGQVAIALAKKAYQLYKKMFTSPRFNKLAEKGAKSQRLLWASTGTKNPAYSEIKYIESLIGFDTITTLPFETYNQYRDQGQPRITLEDDTNHVINNLNYLPDFGIDMNVLSKQLEEEGIQKFIVAFDKLMKKIKLYSHHQG